MIVETRHRPSALRSPAIGLFDIGAIVRRLDWLLLLAAGALVAYGLWAIGGITRFDVPGNPDYYVTRQAIAAGIGLAGMVVAIFIPTSVYERHWRALYGATIGAHAVRLRVRGGRARLEAVDRRGAVPAPALRVR